MSDNHPIFIFENSWSLKLTSLKELSKLKEIGSSLCSPTMTSKRIDISSGVLARHPGVEITGRFFFFSFVL